MWEQKKNGFGLCRKYLHWVDGLDDIVVKAVFGVDNSNVEEYIANQKSLNKQNSKEDNYTGLLMNVHKKVSFWRNGYEHIDEYVEEDVEEEWKKAS